MFSQCKPYDSLEAEKRKGFVLFSIGSSDPTERLGNQTINDKNAGLAMTGVNARLTAGYRIKDKYGLIFISEVQDFPINIQEIADYTANQHPGMNVKVEGFKGWSMNNLMAGIYGHFPISDDKRLIVEPKALFGLSMASSPQFKNTIYYLSNGYTKSTYYEQQSSVSYLAGVYCIGGGLKYNFCKRLTVSGNVDYVATVGEHEFSGIRVEYNTGEWETRNVNMRFSSICITAGFGFRFGNFE
jgi:hypothetical protein